MGALLLAACLPAAAASDLLAPYHWKQRLVIAFAPVWDDEHHLAFRDAFGRQWNGMKKRDTTDISVMPNAFFVRAPVPPDLMGTTASDVSALRQRFRIAPDEFAVILVGLDGTEKARWSEPVDPAELFALIDAMPMRLREMREGAE